MISVRRKSHTVVPTQVHYDSKNDANSTVCNCIKQQCSVARWTIQSGATKESGTTILRAVQKQKNCVKRGDEMSCSYAAPGSRKKQSGASPSSNNPGDMQNRIDRLEGLVLSLMTNGAQSSGPAAANRTLSMSDGTGSMEYPQDAEIDGLDSRNSSMLRPDGEEGESETDQVAQSLGVLKVFDNKSLYFGEAHWAAILKDISEVKNFFAEHKKQLDEQAQRVQESKTEENFPQGPTFLFDGSNAPEFPELLNSLPKRIITDKLVARFFNTFDPTTHILHPNSWYKHYEVFWADPYTLGPAWLAQVFAVLCLAMQSYYKMGDEPPEYRGKSLILANKYRSLTAQSLQRADFLKPVSHSIEALLLHLHAEFTRNRDAEVEIWVLVGMIVRLVMRMGYHRDSKLFPNVTPFHGEMRRRIWTFVRQSDLLFSFQLGLPSMIRLGDCDTALPGNYHDDDLFEDMKALPPPRPNTEATPVSYMIAKASLSFCFGKIVESLHVVSSCSYEDIMQLDENLRQARAELPPHLRLRTIEESMMDPGDIILQRFFLSILYHKGQCVLHRKFLARARENPKYSHSRRACVDSSMELLNHQATLHYESKPGRRLHDVKILMSSLTSHDFLLAAMIISLDLWCGAEAEGVGGRNSSDLYTWGLERREEMIRALEISNDIWKETQDRSMESYKASTILTLIIDKMKNRVQQPGARQSSNLFPFPSMTNGNPTSPYPPQTRMEEKPEHSAAMTLGMLSSGGLTPNSGAMFSNPNGNGYATNANIIDTTQIPGGASNYQSWEQAANTIPSAPSPFSFMTSGADMPVNIDWDAWDSYVNAGLDTVNQSWSGGMEMANSSVAPTAPMSTGDQQQQNNLFASGNNPFAGGASNMPL
ncbi:MAG: hypothetical protein Q9181_000722 [Wetmoreana brouardii]